jgi:hypothetical protein
MVSFCYTGIVKRKISDSDWSWHKCENVLGKQSKKSWECGSSGRVFCLASARPKVQISVPLKSK